MRLCEVFIRENDIEHAETLERTGFWGKAGAGALVFSLNTSRFLIGHRSSMVEQPNTWGTFGGAIDSDEQPLKAAIREVVEETGLSLNDIVDSKLVYTFEHPESGFRYFNYIVVVEDEFTPRLNWENQEAKWFECHDIPQPIHFGLQSLIDSSGFKNFINNYCQ